MVPLAERARHCSGMPPVRLLPDRFSVCTQQCRTSATGVHASIVVRMRGGRLVTET